MILEFFLNTGVSYVFAKLLGLTGVDLLLVIIGASLIDIDHVFHFFLKGVRLRDLKTTFQQEFKNHHPHFYIFHTFEFLLLALFFTWTRELHWLYLFFGFTLNFILDILTYIYVYKSYKPWLMYFSALNIFILKIRHFVRNSIS